MADNATGLQVKLVDGTTPSQIAAVDASGRLSTNIGSYGGTSTTLGQKVMASSIPVTLSSDQSTLVVDTELTAVAALADATSNPTITNIASFLMGYNGATWDRVRVANTGRLQVDVITGGGSATQYVGDAAATATPTGTMTMGLANAAAPAGVSADNDAVAQWFLRNGSSVVNLASGGTLITAGQKTMSASLPVVIASDQSAIAVDSELPAAAALANATANPTVPGVGAFLMGYNGATWDRISTANTGRLQVDVITGAGSTLVDNAAFTDGTTPVTPVGFIFDEVAGTALTENDIAAARVNANRAQVFTLEDSGTRGQRLAVSAAGAAAMNLTQVGGATHSATVPVFARMTDGTVVYAKTGQAAGTAAFAQLSDQTNTVSVIAATNALKTDISSIAGTAPSATVPLPVRLTDGAAFYSAGSPAPTLPKFSAKTSAALGAGASVDLTHYVTSGKTGQLAGLDVSSTVPLKVIINTEVTASKTARVVLFSQPYTPLQWRSPYKTYITQASADATSGFSVSLKNMDSSVAADVYSTGYWDEV